MITFHQRCFQCHPIHVIEVAFERDTAEERRKASDFVRDIRKEHERATGHRQFSAIEEIRK